MCVCIVSRSIAFHGDNPTPEVCATLKRIMFTADAARGKDDYEFLDKYGTHAQAARIEQLSSACAEQCSHLKMSRHVCIHIAVHSVNYFSDVPPHERLRYLRAVKGIEIDRGEALFNIGDAADSFYCVLYGTLNVVLDFAHMSAPTLNDFEEILNRARVHASLLNPGGAESVYGAYAQQ